jgi:predicted phosphate transport protein (TIGR00153 family)
MMTWFQRLMPREEKFFDYFEQHATTLVEGSRALRELLEPGSDIAASCARVSKFENDADEITREVMLAVRRTFITPFDRSDIQALVGSMDDAIDQMKQTSKTVMLYEVKEFDPKMREIADLVIGAADITVDMVGALRNMKKNANRLMGLAVKMTRLEERSDDLYDDGLKELFRRHRAQDPMGFIVGQEIYSHLERVVDRFEDVANQINTIVVEHL